MTNRELIERLQDLDPSLPVSVSFVECGPSSNHYYRSGIDGAIQDDEEGKVHLITSDWDIYEPSRLKRIRKNEST